MINTLHIKNIGIIEDITIDLNKGLNVLTGETGAGKTLIVDALEIIAGGRFSKDMIRKGETNSYVELSIFSLSNLEDVIVSREINTSGKNLCKINGRMSTVNELREYMKNIIDIHGQFDNQTLFDTKYHTKYLDEFIGEKIKNIKNEYQEKFKIYNEVNEKLLKNFGDDKERKRELDLLNYEIHEIEIANLKDGEEEELENEKQIIENSEKINENLNIIDTNLGNTAIDAISLSIKSLEKIENVDETFKEKLSELKNIYYEVQELSRDVSDIKEETTFDEEERDKVEERLDLIHNLKRKYGNSIKEILEYYNSLTKKVKHIESLDEENLKLKNELRTIENEMTKSCEKIQILREEFRIKLNDKINNELSELEMKNARFDAKQINDEKYTVDGKSHIEFMISTNIGEDEKSLLKIASGGEISRIMLAIKTVLSDIDEVSTLVFDEIDTGISGKAANTVGLKLRKIAQKHQVLIVTHLAQIAAKGEYNYYIYKEVKDNNTLTKVKLLKENEILREIARISTGDISEIALSHAKELRKVS